MNQPSPTVSAPAPAAAPSPPPDAPASGVAVQSYEQRVAAVNEAMDAAYNEANPSGPPGEPTDKLTASVEVDPSVAAAAAPDAEAVAAAQRAEERKQRLAALTARTRDQVDRKAQQAAADKLARDYEAAQRRAEEAEKVAAARVDVSGLNPASFLALAEQQGIKAQDLIRFISDSMTSPEKIAEAAALQATKQTYDPKLSAMEKRLADQDARIAAYEQQQQEMRVRAQEQQQTHAFLGLVQQSAARAPLAARLLATDQTEFLEMANIAAQRVPGMGAQALLDAVEDLLDGDGRTHAQKMAALYGLTTPSQPPAPVQPTIRGAAKPNTVSNSLAQGRTALVDEDDLGRLTLEERAARIIRSR